VRDLFIDRPVRRWAPRYRTRLRAKQRRCRARGRDESVNPKYVLRNYLAQVAIEKAE
jgi:uncharacterized protein YdiU (UPF0061 family)